MISNVEELSAFISKLVRHYSLCEAYTSRLRVELLRELSFDGQLSKLNVEALVRKQRRIEAKVKWLTPHAL